MQYHTAGRAIEVAQRVTRAREAVDMTKSTLAEHLGLSKQGYTPYENGQTPFTIEQLYVLSRVLGRSVAWFLGLPSELTAEEDELVTRFRHLDRSAKDAIIGLARTLDRG